MYVHELNIAMITEICLQLSLKMVSRFGIDLAVLVDREGKKEMIGDKIFVFI